MIQLKTENTNLLTENVRPFDPETFRLWVDGKKAIEFDLETSGLEPSESKILTFQFGDEYMQFVFDAQYNNIEDYREILEEKVLLIHNAAFELKWLIKHNIKPRSYRCTLMAEKVIHLGDNTIRNGLKEVADRRLNVTFDKDVRQSFIGADGLKYPEQVEYAAQDVGCLTLIWRQQSGELQAQKLKNTYQLQNLFVWVQANMEYEGMLVDQERWMDNYNRLAPKEQEWREKLAEIVINEPKLSKHVCTQYEMFGPPTVDVKWSSTKQVVRLFQYLDPTMESAKAEEVALRKSTHPLFDAYSNLTTLLKWRGSFGKAWLEKNVGIDGRVRTSFNPLMRTGRLSSSSPNMQQIPAKEEVEVVLGDQNAYRACFIPNYKDWVFVSSDFTGQELALIAFASQDPVWLDALENNQDLHSVTAAMVFKEEWEQTAEDGCAFMERKAKCKCKRHKSLRTAVKSINFGLAYGMSHVRLSKVLDISEDEAKAMIRQYFKTFPKIGDFLDGSAAYGLKNRSIRTFAPFYTRRKFSWKDNDGSVERQSKNTPFQGSGADMTKYAALLVQKYIEDNDYHAKIVMTVHDQIDTICHKDVAEEWKVILTDLMEKAAKKIVTNGLLKSDTEVSPTWKK